MSASWHVHAVLLGSLHERGGMAQVAGLMTLSSSHVACGGAEVCIDMPRVFLCVIPFSISYRSLLARPQPLQLLV